MHVKAKVRLIVHTWLLPSNPSYPWVGFGLPFWTEVLKMKKLDWNLFEKGSFLLSAEREVFFQEKQSWISKRFED